MIAEGVRHGRTLDGTARWFGSIGFRQPGSRLKPVLLSRSAPALPSDLAAGVQDRFCMRRSALPAWNPDGSDSVQP